MLRSAAVIERGSTTLTNRTQNAPISPISPTSPISPAIPLAGSLAPRWEADCYRYASSMTVTASLLLDGEEVRDGLYEIAAFSGDECRGNALLENIEGFENPLMGFLMIFGDENDPITLKIYDHVTGKEYMASERFDFETDASFGTPDNTWPVSLSSTTGNDIPGSLIGIFPNPVEKLLYIKHNGVLDRLAVMDLTGRIMRIEKDFTGTSIDVSQYAAGVYILKIQSAGRTSVFKFTKK
jgi:hypothetical protein